MMTRSFAGRRAFRPTPKPETPILYPAGTNLAEIPPFARGLTEMEYLDHCIAQWKSLPAPVPEPVAAPAPVFGRRLRR